MTKALRLRLCAAVLIPWLASACSTLQFEPLPEPIRPPKALPAETAAYGEDALPPSEEPRDGLRTTRAPGVVIQRTVAEGIADRLGEDLTGNPIRVSFHDVPLIPFINEVFGEELGMSFVIAPGLREKTDLVTLKLTEPLAPPPALRHRPARAARVRCRLAGGGGEHPELHPQPGDRLARRAPARQRPDPARGAGEPSHHFPVGALEGRGPQVRGWLKEAFERQDLKILEDPDRNALLLKGNVDMIARALAMIEALDQPLLQSRHGLIIEPLFMQASDMANALNTILRAEGYESNVGARSGGSVVLLALQGVAKVVAFALDEPTLDHIEAWAEALDVSGKDSIEEAVFTYEVRNTQAEELVETLNQVLGAGAAPARSGPRSRASSSGWTGPSPRC